MYYKTLLKGRMLIFVTEYVGLYCPGRGGWDLLKYQIAMNSLEHPSCLLTLDMMQLELQSFVEQRPLSLDSWARILPHGRLVWLTLDSAGSPLVLQYYLCIPDCSREEFSMWKEHDRSCSKLNLAAARISGPENSVEPSHLSLLTCDLWKLVKINRNHYYWDFNHCIIYWNNGARVSVKAARPTEAEICCSTQKGINQETWKCYLY